MSTPATTDIRCCWRCGVDWPGWGTYAADAPCADCREFLKRVDGVKRNWKKPADHPSQRPQPVAA